MPGFYESNLELAARKFPVELLKQTGTAKSFELIKTASDDYTAKVPILNGATIFLHSRFDPVQEGMTFVESKDFSRHDAVICLGFGLGYHVQYLAKKLPPNVWLTFVESDIELFNEALKLRDFSDLFSRERLIFFIGNKKEEFLRWMRDFLNITESDTMMILSHPPSMRKDPKFYFPLEVEVNSAVNRRVIELNTLVHFRQELDRNAMVNSLPMLRSPGFSNFKGVFDGIPAIVVASGPSLDLILPELKKLKENAVIICASRSFKLLVRENINPHFVVTLDMSDASLKFFDGFEIPSEPVLVYDPDSYHEIVKSYKHRKISYLQTTNYSRWLKKFKEDLTELKKGLSVAHMGFYFADYLGCNPISLVGVDLALPTDNTHAQGVAHTWGGKVEMDERDPNLVYIPSVIDGKNVRSLKTFQSFVSVFEADIIGMNKIIVNTSPFGARIRGSAEMSFSKFIDDHCKESRSIWNIIDAIFGKPNSFKEKEFFTELRAKLEKSKQVLKELEEVIKRINRLPSLKPDVNQYDTEKFSEITRSSEKFVNDLLRDQEINPFLQRLLSKGALDFKKMTKEIQYETDSTKKRKKEIKRFNDYVFEYKKSLEYFNKCIQAIFDLE
ncbi:MAG: DUF115 domain-containing protein [Planctomycetes bacterium]|nr:DUF115 domain-containing protein [Planctomycetota bacterium]